jgi:hypothetical protein
MICCPQCGALNRKGSNYCGSCGQSLATAATVQCPVCKEMNSAQGSLCASCGAALAAPEHGDETHAEEQFEPSLPDPALAVRRELPPWLRSPPGQIREAGSEEAPPASNGEPAAHRESSEYLKGIRGALPASAGWLASSVSRGLAQRTQRPPDQ